MIASVFAWGIVALLSWSFGPIVLLIVAVILVLTVIGACRP